MLIHLAGQVVSPPRGFGGGIVEQPWPTRIAGLPRAPGANFGFGASSAPENAFGDETARLPMPSAGVAPTTAKPGSASNLSGTPILSMTRPPTPWLGLLPRFPKNAFLPPRARKGCVIFLNLVLRLGVKGCDRHPPKIISAINDVGAPYVAPERENLPTSESEETVAGVEISIRDPTYPCLH